MKARAAQAKFDRGAWLALAVVAAFLLTTLVHVLLGFNYPSDGWAQNGDNISGAYVPLYNVAGVASPLEKGDVIIAINGQALKPRTPPPLPANLQVGATVRYTVRRGAETREVDVTLVRRSPLDLVRALAAETAANPFGTLGPILSVLVAGFVFFSRPASPAARYLFLIFGYYVCITIGLADYQLYRYAYPLPLRFLEAMEGGSWAWFFFPTWILFLLVFPVVKLPMRRFPVLLPAVLYGTLFPASIVLALLGLLAPADWLDYAQFGIFGAILALFVLTLFATLIHNWLTVRDPIVRAQLRWIALGLASWGIFVPVGLVVSNTVTDLALRRQINDALLGAVPVLLPLCLAVAITRYRLFEIDVIIRRTLTYALLTGALLAVFFGSVVLLQQLFAAVTGARQNELVTVLSTLAIAALFVPMRNRIQSTIDRRFNRNKYNAQRVLERFALSVRDETNLEHLTGALLSVVQDTVQPQSSSVWLKSSHEHARQTGSVASR